MGRATRGSGGGHLFRRRAALAGRAAVVQRLLRPCGEVGVARRRPAHRVRDRRPALRPRLDARRLDADRLDDQAPGAAPRARRRDQPSTPTSATSPTFHCNDMVVDAAGRAYVGNFGFDLDAEIAARGVPAVLADHATAKLAFVAPDGAVRVAAEDMHFPNGSVITPDGKTLIVGETLAAVPHRLRHRRRRRPLQPPGLGADHARASPTASAWTPTGAIWIANPDRAGMRADRRGRRGARGDRHRPALLRLHAGRRRRTHPVHADRRRARSPTTPPPRRRARC